ncbi:HGxxPAAW family protein [Vallicoccus soli]|uniref:HGxxPAAW family protein n=1 Tax=Vallicoccus soli TaxID=2339232 RepID=UPI0010595192|nr:HGxxPAAW family protein [Vallicoccus soli]
MVESSPRGRPVSWAVVAVVIVGFIVGGLGLILGPTWWLFWVGVVLSVGGIVVGWATGMMEDVH